MCSTTERNKAKKLEFKYMPKMATQEAMSILMLLSHSMKKS